MKKFACSLKDFGSKVVIHDCIPCYKEEQMSYQYVKVISANNIEYTRHVPAFINNMAEAKLVVIYDDNWKYIAEAILYKGEVCSQNIGSSNSCVEDILARKYLSDNDVWNNLTDGCDYI